MRHALPTLLQRVLVLGTLLFVPATLPAAETLTASQARHHVGEEATVCGEVASTRYAASSRGQPTFLNFDKPYPDQVFTVVIWIEDRRKFDQAPEVRFRDERICVSGTISSYRGVPQIEVDEPEQIEIQASKRTVKKSTVWSEIMSQLQGPRYGACFAPVHRGRPDPKYRSLGSA